MFGLAFFLTLCVFGLAFFLTFCVFGLTFFLTLCVFGFCFRTLADILVSDLFDFLAIVILASTSLVHSVLEA